MLQSPHPNLPIDVLNSKSHHLFSRTLTHQHLQTLLITSPGSSTDFPFSSHCSHFPLTSPPINHAPGHNHSILRTQTPYPSHYHNCGSINSPKAKSQKLIQKCPWSVQSTSTHLQVHRQPVSSDPVTNPVTNPIEPHAPMPDQNLPKSPSLT